MRSVENAECRKCGVKKMRSVEKMSYFQFFIPFLRASIDCYYTEFIIMQSALISIFYLPIRYCFLELQKNIVRFSPVSVRMYPVLKSIDRLLIS